MKKSWLSLLCVATLSLAMGGCGGGGGGGSSIGASIGGVTLMDSSGAPLGSKAVASSHPIMGSVTGLGAYDQAAICVTGVLPSSVTPPYGLPNCSFFSTLKSDKTGTVATSAFTPRLPAGTYRAQIYDLTQPNSTTVKPVLKADIAFTVSDTAAGVHVTTGTYAASTLTPTGVFLPGNSIYVKGSGLAKNATITVYVTDHQTTWTSGNALVDVSGYTANTPPDLPVGSKIARPKLLTGTAKMVTTDANGNFGPLLLWSSINAEADQQVFDVVIDTKNTGFFDPTADYVSDEGFGSLTVDSTISRATAPNTVKLACDKNGNPSSSFLPEQTVDCQLNPSLGQTVTNKSVLGDARLYLVAHKTAWKTGDLLVDLSGPRGTSSFATINTIDGKPWLPKMDAYCPDLISGSYDLIVNFDQTGVYKAGVDLLDGGAAGASIQVGATTTKKAWTVMVYMDGDNNLEPYAIFNFLQMQSANYGNNPNVNVVVQLARANGYDTTNGDWKTCRRFLMAHSNKTNVMDVNPISDIGKVNMALPSTLTSFITWAKNYAPANNYALILWDHGSGFKTRGITPPIIRNAIYDEDFSNASMTVNSVHDAIKAAGSVDLVDFDTCLMGMTEIAYQMRDVCKAMKVSEDVEQGTGDEYSGFINALLANPSMTPQDLAKAIVTSDSTFYATAGGSYTMSAIDETKIADVATAVNGVCAALAVDPDGNGRLVDRDATKAAMYSTWELVQRFTAQSASYASYADAGDLFKQIKAAAIDSGVSTACDTAVTAVNSAVLSQTHDAGYANATGLTIWFPTGSSLPTDLPAYQPLGFAADTSWQTRLSDIWTAQITHPGDLVYVPGATGKLTATPGKATGRTFHWTVVTGNGKIDDGTLAPAARIDTAESAVKIKCDPTATGNVTVQVSINQAMSVGTYRSIVIGTGIISAPALPTHPQALTLNNYLVPNPQGTDPIIGTYVAMLTVPKVANSRTLRVIRFVQGVPYFGTQFTVGPITGAIDPGNVKGPFGNPGTGVIFTKKVNLNEVPAGQTIEPQLQVYDFGDRVEMPVAFYSYSNSTKSTALSIMTPYIQNYTLDASWVTP